MKKIKRGAYTPLGWVELNERLGSMSEAQVRQLLEKERTGRRRATFLRRIHQRLTRLRANRERAALRKSP